MDVTHLPTVEEVIATAREQLGEPPSLLVNSAGITGGAACHLMDEESFDSVIDVNLKVCEPLIESAEMLFTRVTYVFVVRVVFAFIFMSVKVVSDEYRESLSGTMVIHALP